MNRSITIVVLMLLAVAGYSQTPTQRLNQAEDDYEAGRLLRVPGQIEGILDELTKEERIRAKNLLTLVYIFTDQEEKADAWMIELLREDPEHALNPKVDPAEIFFLRDQFRTAPIFKLTARGGANFSNPIVTRYRGTGHTENSPLFINGKTPDGEKSYRYNGLFEEEDFASQNGVGVGFFGELMIEKYINHGMEVGFGFQGRFSQYNVEQFLNDDNFKTTLSDKQFMMRTPLQLKYTHWYQNPDRGELEKAGIFLPYVLIGTSFDYLVSASYDAENTIGIPTVTTDEDLIASSQVNRYNMSFYAGAGVKIRSKTHFWTIEGRYEFSPWNYTKSENGYTNQTTIIENAYVSPDIRLSFFSLSVGFTYSVHKPIKLR